MMSSIVENNWASLNTSVMEPPFPRDFRSVPSAQFEETNASYIYSSLENIQGDNGGGELASFQNMTQMLDLQEVFDNRSNSTPSIPNFGGGTEYIFDRSDVRAIFLVLYTIVFCSCFFGNLMVILVVTLHWRMRSITNFCLANLAFADLCVGIFCVYQNIVTYLMESWIFGEFLCKMFHFINSLSTTASVLILVVICIERYLAIIHPMKCKEMMTIGRLRVTIIFVWILSAAISSPRFYYFNTLEFPLPNGKYEILCLPNRLKYDSKWMDMISMTVLFLIPLAIISVLYTQIGIVLWKSSDTKMQASTPSVESSTSSECYYREADTHILQAVNLTLLPASDQQLQHQLYSHCPSNRLNALHGISTSCSTPPPTRTEKRGMSSSLLPSPFICLKCRNKSRSKSHRKCTKKHTCRASCRILNNGTTAAAPTTAGNRMCARHIPLDPPNITGTGALNASLGGSGVGPESVINCKVCQSSFPNISNAPYETTDSAQTTSFINSSCNHHHHPQSIIENATRFGGASSVENENGVECGVPTRNEATSSPSTTTTCCGGRPTSICLRKQGSQEKAVTFTNSSPPSPFCNRNCACLEGKSSKTEPIVLVKFEKKKKQTKKGRRNQQCTILMMNTNQCPNTGSGKRIEVDSDDCTDSPQTVSPSPPRFDCVICHPASAGNEITTEEGKISTRGIHTHSCHAKNFSFEHTKNLSVDSGISGMPGNITTTTTSIGRIVNIDRTACDQTPDGTGRTVPCLSCGQHNHYQSNHYHHHCVPSPKPGVSPLPSQPKRLKRMRIVRSSKYGTGALKSRRRIIKMLIVVVLAFALCHLPFHARKVWQYWSPEWAKYQAGSVFSTLFTPITWTLLYANSALNPLLYAFLSKKFRMSIKDLICCRMRHSLRISRNASVRSTHAVQLSQVGL